MTVKSVDLKDGQPVGRQYTAINWGLKWRATGAFAFLLGVPLWLVGARFTTLGAPGMIALTFSLFRISVHIPLPDGWTLFYLTIIVGAVISAAEFGCRPRRSFFAQSLLMGAVLFLVWSIANAGDLGSTFIGVTTPHADSWPITIWVAETTWAAIAVTIFLTYLPELLMIAGIRWFIKGRF